MVRTQRRRIALAVIAVGVALILVGAWAVRTQLHQSPDTHTVVAPGCPTVISGTSNAADDYADLFTWAGTFFVRQGLLADGRAHSAIPTERIGTITCSLADPDSTGGMRIAPGAWPDGVATGLSTGTVIYRVDGHDPTCLLAVTVAGKVISYRAWNFETNSAAC